MAVNVLHKAQGAVTRAQALKNPTTHSFAPGVGYAHHPRPPKTNPGTMPTGLCSPSAGTPDGSKHVLSSPGGGAKLEFTWVALHSAWARSGGLRMAFTADYLSRAGWTYVGVSTPPPVPTKGA